MPAWRAFLVYLLAISESITCYQRNGVVTRFGTIVLDIVQHRPSVVPPLDHSIKQGDKTFDLELRMKKALYVGRLQEILWELLRIWTAFSIWFPSGATSFFTSHDKAKDENFRPTMELRGSWSTSLEWITWKSPVFNFWGGDQKWYSIT